MHNCVIAQYYYAWTGLQLDRLKTARGKRGGKGWGMMLRIDAE